MKRLFTLMMLVALLMAGCNKSVLSEDETQVGELPELPDKDNPMNEEIDLRMFDALNLDAAGLEDVKRAFEAEEYHRAASRLLDYYRTRSGVIHPNVQLVNVKPTAGDIQYADAALEGKFFGAKGYDPPVYITFDQDGNIVSIDWKLSETQGADNEVCWQLHRHQWFVPLAKMYRSTGDEKYFKAWRDVYTDWIKQNPSTLPADATPEDRNHLKFTWRALETSARIEVMCEEFLYLISSPNFTPELLSMFLVNLKHHTDYVINNYAADGNHIIMEAQRVVYAACIFPEMAQSEEWLQNGSAKLGDEIIKQVLPDGMQYELDYGYHIAAINDFNNAYNMVAINRRTNHFSPDYTSRLRNMMELVKNITFPNYTIPQFDDTKQNSWSNSVLSRNFRTYNTVFPDDKEFLWLGTNGREGKKPFSLNRSFTSSGYYILRNGWDMSSTVMVMSNGPAGPNGGSGYPEGFHNQIDNGTFELWYNGRNFFPDSGVYKYEGDAQTNQERREFRQSRMHNTMTVGYANIQKCAGLLWVDDIESQANVLVTSNQNGAINHRRTIFFVDKLSAKPFFVLVDEAIGSGTGTLNLNFNMLEGDNVVQDLTNHTVYTNYATGSNMFVQTFAPVGATLTSEQFAGGKVSYDINKVIARPGSCWAVNQTKSASVTARYLTVLLPMNTNPEDAKPVISATFNQEYSKTGIDVSITIDGVTRPLSCTIPETPIAITGQTN